jgi:hypothetical protein
VRCGGRAVAERAVAERAEIIGPSIFGYSADPTGSG